MPLHSASTLEPATINSVSVPVLLSWWQQRKRIASVRSYPSATLPKSDEIYLRAYYRLMEVYSVVKSGGVQAQTEAVKAFARRESGLLNQRLQEIETATELEEDVKLQEREKVNQEIEELRSANSWRLQTLTNIAPDEEAVVQRYLADIEKTLMHAQCA